VVFGVLFWWRNPIKEKVIGNKRQAESQRKGRIAI